MIEEIYDSGLVGKHPSVYDTLIQMLNANWKIQLLLMHRVWESEAAAAFFGVPSILLNTSLVHFHSLRNSSLDPKQKINPNHPQCTHHYTVPQRTSNLNLTPFQTPQSQFQSSPLPRSKTALDLPFTLYANPELPLHQQHQPPPSNPSPHPATQQLNQPISPLA